ncbi:MAG: glycosyltransferase family 4 protein [Clostridiales bacterium]|nr:MAG: glycosyltransferase family 4 protein [Clostridiales bacterium]
MSARIAAKISGAKIIYTRHSVFEPPKKISHGIGKFINGAVNNFFADKIIAVAEAAKDNLTRTGVSEKKITVIKNGVDALKRYDKETVAKIKSDYGINDEFVLSIAARLTYVKGHKYILKAVKMLADDGENFKLIIAGTGEYEDEIKKEISALNLENSVIMAGFVKDVEALNNITDLNLNFSFGTEATSLSLLEGMSLGIPAVVSDFGGNPGVIRDNENGFLVPSKDYKSLYEKIKLAMDDRELYKRLCEGSRRIFESEFTADKVTRRIESVYDEVILQKEKRKMKKKLSIIDILIILIAVVCAVFAVKYFTANSKKAYNVPEVSYVVELKSLSDEYLDVFKEGDKITDGVKGGYLGSVKKLR